MQNFQSESEMKLDQKAQELEFKVNQLEKEVKAKGLDINYQEEDTIAMQVNDPGFINLKKKEVESHSINAIHKKYYTKIKEQRDQLQLKLTMYNDNIKAQRAESNNKDKIDVDLIDIDNHPLMKHLNETLAELQEALPKITSRLPWRSSKLFKPRSSSSNIRAPQRHNKVSFKNRYSNNDLHSNNILVKSRNTNSKSVNDLANKSNNVQPTGRQVHLTAKQASTIEVLRVNGARSYVKDTLTGNENYTPYHQGNLKPALSGSTANKQTSNSAMAISDQNDSYTYDEDWR